jgi:hypothetical protein
MTAVNGSGSTSIVVGALPQLRRLVADFPPRRPGFDPRPDRVGFVVDKVELVQVLYEYSELVQ